MARQEGVFLGPDGWTWYHASGIEGPVFKFRDDARASYKAYREQCRSTAVSAPSPEGGETATTAEAPQAQVEEVEQPATDPQPDGQEKEPMAKVSKKSPKKASPKKGKGTAKAGASKKVGSITAKVFEIAGSMKSAPRKDVIVACEKAGVNKATANTQYQRWLHRGDA